MYQEILNTNQLNEMQLYFGRDMRPLPNVIRNPQNKPDYCRETFQSNFKPACNACIKLCRHSIEMILDPAKGFSKEDILIELKYHNHPKTRIMPDHRQRDLSEAKRELADHYIYAHGYVEPVFLT
jgi:hypothetical protein